MKIQSVKYEERSAKRILNTELSGRWTVTSITELPPQSTDDTNLTHQNTRTASSRDTDSRGTQLSRSACADCHKWEAEKKNRSHIKSTNPTSKQSTPNEGRRDEEHNDNKFDEDKRSTTTKNMSKHDSKHRTQMTTGEHSDMWKKKHDLEKKI